MKPHPFISSLYIINTDSGIHLKLTFLSIWIALLIGVHVHVYILYVCIPFSICEPLPLAFPSSCTAPLAPLLLITDEPLLFLIVIPLHLGGLAALGGGLVILALPLGGPVALLVLFLLPLLILVFVLLVLAAAAAAFLAATAAVLLFLPVPGVREGDGVKWDEKVSCNDKVQKNDSGCAKAGVIVRVKTKIGLTNLKKGAELVRGIQASHEKMAPHPPNYKQDIHRSREISIFCEEEKKNRHNQEIIGLEQSICLNMFKLRRPAMIPLPPQKKKDFHIAKLFRTSRIILIIFHI